jgi:hypothetical protein
LVPGSKECIALPSKEWSDADGNKRYFPFAKFEQAIDQRKFNEAALTAIKQIAERRRAPRPRSLFKAAAKPTGRALDLPNDRVDDLWRA